ncbi:hypothetical protein LMG22037_05200 [Paraburkholderia phenoliruptrix]|uniref:PTS EIIA type-2 domain-containing protein n=1 Tax=Paraburkholderia phenoliruptrix TaxID=252970 RepID=A0A6J5C4N6_9BURK|nr:hypothetical protein LMG22037_05200 [Paraburkholderia phenoliruptrix]
MIARSHNLCRTRRPNLQLSVGHCLKGLKQPLAAFVRLAEPIPFESPDGQPVSLLIFLLVPEQATQQHLEILSEIAQLLSDRDARERLHTEQDRESLHRLLTQWQP